MIVTLMSYCSLSCCAISSNCGFLLAVMTRFQPSCANFIAKALPIPAEAPVMRAVLFNMGFPVRGEGIRVLQCGQGLRRPLKLGLKILLW